jgi:histidinol-phosphate/aromatic aminotransferase/cobyric acid decarboxylase-like protein
LAALRAEGYLERCRVEVRTAMGGLIRELGEMGFKILPSAANYFLMEVGDGAGFRRALFSRGVLVRDGASFGLPEYVRIGVRTTVECKRLVEAIRGMRPSSSAVRGLEGDKQKAMEACGDR